MEFLGVFLERISRIGAFPLMALFAANAVFLFRALWIALEKAPTPGSLFDSFRNVYRLHGLPLLGLVTFAALIRWHYAPFYFQTLGLDYWMINDGDRAWAFLSRGVLDFDHGLRSVGHACFFGFYLLVTGFGVSTMFLFNFAAGLLFVVLAYGLVSSLGARRTTSLLAAAAVAALPAAVVTSGGVLDNGLNGVAFLFFLSILARYRAEPIESPVKAPLFSASVLAAAWATQFRHDGFIALWVLGATLVLDRKVLRALFPDKRHLFRELAWTALAFPYAASQAAAYFLHVEDKEPGSLAIGKFFSNMIEHRFVWFYDGASINALLLALLGFACVMGAVRRERPSIGPLLLFFPVYWGVYIFVSAHTGFPPWYSLLSATLLILVAAVFLDRGFPKGPFPALLLFSLASVYAYASARAEFDHDSHSEFATRIARELQHRHEEDSALKVFEGGGAFHVDWAFPKGRLGRVPHASELLSSELAEGAWSLFVFPELFGQGFGSEKRDFGPRWRSKELLVEGRGRAYRYYRLERKAGDSKG